MDSKSVRAPRGPSPTACRRIIVHEIKARAVTEDAMIEDAYVVYYLSGARVEVLSRKEVVTR